MTTVDKFYKLGLITPPKWLVNNVHYEILAGSYSYGTQTDSSDLDHFGFAIPKKEVVFPHLAGCIQGFDQPEVFNQWQEQVVHEDKQHDFNISSIVKYFRLLVENNPNMVDTVFCPRDSIVHISSIGEMVRARRCDFLHKGCIKNFLGYALSQVHKAKQKTPVGKRKERFDKFGYDVKFLSHTVRLLTEVIQIMESDGQQLDLRKDCAFIRSVKLGEVSQEDTLKSVEELEFKARELEKTTKLRESIDLSSIKQLLLDCLEHHYGSLDKVIDRPNKDRDILMQIRSLVND